MKMKNIFKISALFIASLFLFSCNEFEEFESENLGTHPTATLALVNASDSMITVNITNSANGYVVAVLIPGTDNEVPEDPETLALNNIENNEYFYSEATASTEITAVFTEGIEQNSLYEIMAVVADENGLLSTIEVLQVTTTDIYAPALMATYPSPTYDPILLVADTVYLEFDEIVTAGSGTFTFETIFDGQSYDVPADSISYLGYYVGIRLPFEAINGDYVLLSWTEGAVTDLVGNNVPALSSGIVGSSLDGIFWRTVHAERDYSAIAPDQSVAQTPGFDIEITYAEALDYATVYNAATDSYDLVIEDGSIVLTYDNEDGTVTLNDVPASDVSIAGNVLTIVQSKAINWTGTVTVNIPSGLFEVGFSNPMAPVSETWNTTEIP